VPESVYEESRHGKGHWTVPDRAASLELAFGSTQRLAV
jgi:hypothetical protein